MKDWWDSKSNEKFKQRSDCLIRQYGNFTSERVGLPIDGKNTLNENIADGEGVKVAYQAYRKFILKNEMHYTTYQSMYAWYTAR